MDWELRRGRENYYWMRRVGRQVVSVLMGHSEIGAIRAWVDGDQRFAGVDIDRGY